MRKTLLLAALVAVIASPALAAPFEVIAINKGDSATLVDVNTFKVGKYVRGRQYTVFYEPQGDDASMYAISSLEEYDCDNRRARSVKLTSYDVYMDVGEEYSKVADWSSPRPGSVNADILKKACGLTNRESIIEGTTDVPVAAFLIIARKTLIKQGR